MSKLNEVSEIKSNTSTKGGSLQKRHLHLVPNNEKNKLLELLPPGSFAKLDSQPKDLPPFQVIYCKGGKCWVRQQAWGKYVHWEVEHHRLKSA